MKITGRSLWKKTGYSKVFSRLLFFDRYEMAH
jgi:hypothetical protein